METWLRGGPIAWRVLVLAAASCSGRSAGSWRSEERYKSETAAGRSQCPKVMPLIRLSGEAFGRHTSVFRARGGLQDVKQIEANRLLDLHGTPLCAIFPDIFDMDIAAAPEIVQVLLLGGEQLLEPLVHYAIQRPLSAAADFFSRGRVGGMVDHVFGELDWTAGPGLDREGNLAKVPGMDGLVGVRTRGLDRIVRGTCQDQAALFGRMAQHGATVFGIAGSLMEHPT